MKIFNYLKRHAGITFQKLLPEIKITGIYSTRKLFSSEHKCGGESDPGCCHHNPNMNQNNVNEMAVRGILKEIKSEDGKSIEEAGLIHNININDTTIKIQINLNKEYRKIKGMIENKLQYQGKKIEVSMAPSASKVSTEQTKVKPGLSKVKNIIAVSSCKGGVGKSTIAINLSYALKRQNKSVGIFDADIYGPSLPILISPKENHIHQSQNDPNLIEPIQFEGIKAMSYGFASSRRAVMRGPIVTQVVTSLISQTDWGDLDFLILDFPPGTGDIQITLCQEVKISGAVIVTTPQRLSFIDVVKGIEMFDEMRIPIVSVVENMAYFTCGKCEEKHYIFGKGYIGMLKKQFGIENSFDLPIDPVITKFSDSGTPYVIGAPETTVSNQIFNDISSNLIKTVDSLTETLRDKPVGTYDPKEGYIIIKHSKDKVKKISPFHLRSKCICAGCVDEISGKKILGRVKEDVHPLKIEEKGNYALAVVWSDGHRSSIYPYKRLLSNEIEGIN